MTAPTAMIYDLAGRPPLIESMARLVTDTPAVCAVSGEHSARTAPVDRALGGNFTDRSIFRSPGPRVGEAAIWCMSGKPPATIRLWSIIAVPGRTLPSSAEKAWLRDTPGLCLTSRGNTRPVIDTLIDPPDGEWLVTVATSGQKHVLPYGTVNHGAGQWTVRMETVSITSTPGMFRDVLMHAAALRRLGARDAEIREGIPPVSLTLDTLHEWRSHTEALSRHTRSPLLDLALWTITKETLNDY